MIGFPNEIKMMVFEQYKRDLQFRMGRDTAQRLRPKYVEGMFDNDIYELRGGIIESYDLTECYEALEDLAFVDYGVKCTHAYEYSVDFLYQRIKYLEQCPLAEDWFTRALIGRLIARDERMEVFEEILDDDIYISIRRLHTAGLP